MVAAMAVISLGATVVSAAPASAETNLSYIFTTDGAPALGSGA
jgi:hypothetical protein